MRAVVPIHRLRGSVLGLAGFGRIPQLVAPKAQAFGMKVVAYDPFITEAKAHQLGVELVSLDELYARADFISIHTPLTPETRGLIDRRTLAQLPRGAHLVNVARGALVVEDDLLAALDSGHVASATLDVFGEEPLPAAHPFWHHPRVTITPHSSAITLVDESTAQIAAKIRRLEQGLPVTGVVDRPHGY
jgi:glyoxylate/hydroxypyruvate reductase A